VRSAARAKSGFGGSGGGAGVEADAGAAASTAPELHRAFACPEIPTARNSGADGEPGGGGRRGGPRAAAWNIEPTEKDTAVVIERCVLDV
jgi:hypothetical protein